MYLLRPYLVWSALKLFCKLHRLCGTFEGRSTYKDGSLDLGLMDTPLPISSSFHGILQLPSLKCKREIMGTSPGFSFIICPVTALVGQDHDPAPHSLLSGSKTNRPASGRGSVITTPGQQRCYLLKRCLGDYSSKPRSAPVIHSIGGKGPNKETSKKRKEKKKKEDVGETVLLFLWVFFKIIRFVFYLC